jgi:hypothetical protein
MDLNLIKKILEKENAKIIIVENGKPIMVISRFEEQLMNSKEGPISPGIEIPENESEEKTEKLFLPKKEEKQGELTIDDLPL